MKLKTNKTFTNIPRQKIRNPKNKNQIEDIIFVKLGFKDEIEK
jgi:hypothetical protein